jgi:hypothetical protein
MHTGHEGDSMLSLARAAQTAGKSKPTLLRAIKNGKLSAIRTASGAYEIDPAELARVFPFAGNIAGTMTQLVPGNGTDTDGAISPGEAKALHRVIAEQAETIRDLRARLDSEVEQRRHMLTLLTDQRRRSWWRRWFR